MADYIQVRLKLEDARPFMAQLGASSASVQTFGRHVEEVGKKTEFSRIETLAWNQALYTLRRYAFYGTLALTGLAGGALRVGFSFLEAEEKSTAAFTGLLGSARLARAEVERLVGLTHVTGFGLTDLTEAAVRMRDFGFSVQDTNKDLRAFGLFAQKRNLGTEGLDALVKVFARIRDQGQLTGRTLMQLRSSGVPAIQLLTRELGLTAGQVRALQKGKLAIPARFALPALTAGIAAVPGTIGLSGLLGIARSWVAELTGTIEAPLFAWATRMTPRISAIFARMTTGFKEGGFRGLFTALDPSGRLTTAWITLGNVLRSFWAVIGVGVRLVSPLLPIFSTLAGLLVLVAGHATVLKVVLYALAGRYLFLRGAMLLTKVAAWGVALAEDAVRVATWALYGALRAATLATWLFNAALDANPIVLIVLGVAALVTGLVVLYRRWKAFHDLVNATASWIKANWPTVVALLVGGPLAAGIVWAATHWQTFVSAVTAGAVAIRDAFVSVGQAIWGAIRGALDQVIRGWNRLHFRIPGFSVGFTHFGGFNLGLPQIPLLAQGGTMLSGGAAIVGDRGPELLNLPTGARVQPLDAGTLGERVFRFVIESAPIVLDGRPIAEAVFQVKQTAEARA